MKQRNLLISVGDGVDPRPLQEQELSHAVAMSARGGDKSAVDEIAADDLPPSATVKIWKMDSLDEEDVPQCVASFRIFSQQFPEQVVESIAGQPRIHFRV